MTKIKIITVAVFTGALFAYLSQAMAQTSGERLLFDFIIPQEPTSAELLTANIGVPISVALSIAGAGALVAVASAGSASVAFNLSRVFQSLKLMRFYLLGLVQFRKKKPWGKVLDKLTGRPVPLATVRIYSAEFKKLLDAHLTDSNGRFDALVLPGLYDVQVLKKGYQKFQKDGVKISSEGQVLNLEIALFPLTESLSAEYIREMRFLQILKHFFRMVAPLALAIGTISSFIVVAVLPTSFNYFVFWLYLALDALQIFFAYHLRKPFGTVTDALSKDPLPLSVVRIFDNDKNWLLETKVSDRIGRFNFLLVPGNYYLTCDKNNYAPFHSDKIAVAKEGSADFDIMMKKAG